MRAFLLVLTLVFATVAGAQLSRTQLDRLAGRIESAPPKKGASLLPEDLLDDGTLRERLAAGDAKARPEAARAVRDLATVAGLAPSPDATKLAAAIKARPEYRDAPADAQATWFSRALDALRRWWQGLFRQPDVPKIGDLDAKPFTLPNWIVYVVYAILAGIVVAAAYPLVRLVRFRIARKARRKGGLLEDEPERTRSEYLVLADELAARGEFRAAIRMRYLATLKRFDEARVARFDRGETNWEHLARIESSATLPAGLDFRPATRAFDLYWYGHRPAGAEEHARFVGWYDDVDGRLRGIA